LESVLDSPPPWAVRLLGSDKLPRVRAAPEAIWVVPRRACLPNNPRWPDAPPLSRPLRSRRTLGPRAASARVVTTNSLCRECRSCGDLLLPAAADDVQLAFHRAQDATHLACNFLVGI